VTEELIELNARKLYILSGPPGSGKSTFIKNNGLENYTLSSDTFRQQIFGKQSAWLDDSGFVTAPYSGQDGRVFKVLRDILDMRMSEGLTTFIDVTAVSDTVRVDYTSIAAKYHIPYEILIFDTPIEAIHNQNLNREARIPPEGVDDFYAKWQQNSRFPFRKIGSQTKIKLINPNILATDKIDAIGDVHGMYDELRTLIHKMGYTIDERSRITHPDNRKLLFLGDVIDRGPKSIEVLSFMRSAVNQGHYAILGNHESKLLKLLKDYRLGNAITPSFTSTLETFYKFLAQPKEYQEEMHNFLSGLPRYYTLDNAGIAFTHANITDFDPFHTPYNKMTYGTAKRGNGKQKLDSDASYFMGWKKRSETKGNHYKLIRGHIPNLSATDAVFSLEDEQAYDGNLVALPIDRFISDGADWRAFEKDRVKQSCQYNYDKVIAPRREIQKELVALAGQKLVNTTVSSDGLMTLYKYGAKVFYDNLWNEHRLLTKARGLVLDHTGKIIQHPFDKVFNWKENGTEVDPDRMVSVADKMNGFFACVRRHPYQSGAWLVTTTGSFDSKFVALAEQVLAPLRRGIMPYLYKNDQSLMFEIVDPSDPHIIDYQEDTHGAWLIGARGWNWDDTPVKETELDTIANTIGAHRSFVKEMTFKEVSDWSKQYRGEGFMIRDSESGEHLCKIKTPYYLTKKFLGRMGDKNIRFMFAEPKKFKKGLDEEFYFIVDAITSITNVKEYGAMENQDKINFVGMIIADYFEVGGANPDTKKRDKLKVR
jgi:predicted kinase